MKSKKGRRRSMDVLRHHISPVLRDLVWHTADYQYASTSTSRLPSYVYILSSRVTTVVLLPMLVSVRRGHEAPAIYGDATHPRSEHYCVVTRTHSNFDFGDRAFASAGPGFWNSLPSHLRDADLSYSLFRRSQKKHCCLDSGATALCELL